MGCSQPELVGAFGQTHVRVVLPEEDAIFRAGGKHSVGFVHAFCNEVVDEDADVRFIPSEDERLPTVAINMRIDAGDESLSARFLVAGRPVDLSGEEKIPDALRLERMVELRRVEEVVLDSIAGSEYLHVAERRDSFERPQLHVQGQRRGKAVQVKLGRVHPFRLEEQLVLGLVRESNNLRLDAGAVARPDTFDLPVVERRVGETFAKDFVAAFVGKARPAASLRQLALHIVQIGELVEVVFPGLHLHLVEVHAAGIDTHRRSGLHPVGAEAQRDELLRQSRRGRFSDASAVDLRPADMHQPVQEGTVREDDRPGVKLHAQARPDARCPFSVGEYRRYHVLPYREVRGILQDAAPALDEACAVALCAGTPHRRSLAPVQHPELDSRAVRYNPHLPAEGIDLADDLPLGNAPDRRVATHLRDFVHIHRYKQRARAEVGCRRRRFTSGVSCADYYYVVFKLHNLC